MSLLNFGLPDAKEMEDAIANVVTDDDRKRWGTPSARDKGIGGKLADETMKPGVDLMQRPLQAQMNAAEHSNFRRADQHDMSVEQSQGGDAEKSSFQKAVESAETRVAGLDAGDPGEGLEAGQ